MCKKVILLLLIVLSVSSFAETRYYSVYNSCEVYDKNTNAFKDTTIEGTQNPIYTAKNFFAVPFDCKKVYMFLYIDNKYVTRYSVKTKSCNIIKINGSLEYTFKDKTSDYSDIKDKNSDGYAIKINNDTITVIFNYNGNYLKAYYKVYKIEAR